MSDRKYGHRGYMEKEREQANRERQERPRERREGPRGRGLGTPTATVWRCRVCGTKQQVVGAVAVGAVCSSCGNDLRTCSNCTYFDTSRPNECSKPVLKRIGNKTRGNECELFVPSAVQEFASERAASSSDPRAAFDALFKKS